MTLGADLPAGAFVGFENDDGGRARARTGPFDETVRGSQARDPAADDDDRRYRSHAELSRARATTPSAHASSALTDWDQPQSLSACGPETVRGADAELLDRLQAVGHEGRAQDQRALDAALRKPDDDLVGVGADPRRPPETRLETHDALVLGDAEA